MKQFLIVIFSLIVCTFCTADEIPLHTVLVSVSPHKFFVERIAEGTLNVVVMVPAGASAHSYEPSPKQMIAASKADLWFYIGEGFEARAKQALKSHHPALQLIDLRQNIPLITAGHHCSKHRGNCEDLHFWLSPKLAKIQAATIATSLIATYPEHRELYQHNLNSFLQELDELDRQIAALLSPLQNRTLLVSHPAYGYFCQEYNLKQISIEWEGKDPTPQQLTNILNEARQAKIKTVFIQPQYSNKGAKLIADVIGANIVSLDPYSESYMTTLLLIAKAFASGLDN